MYTTWGSVTGDCGHVHVSVEEAWDCIMEHGEACRQGHGPNAYSDRHVRVIQDAGDIQSYDITRGPGRRLMEVCEELE